MKRFTDAGRDCLDKNNLYRRANFALMLPDIWGRLKDPGPSSRRSAMKVGARSGYNQNFTIAATKYVPERVF